MYKKIKHNRVHILLLGAGLLYTYPSLGSYSFFASQLFKNGMKYLHYATFIAPFWSSLVLKNTNTKLENLPKADPEVITFIKDELTKSYPNLDINSITIKYDPYTPFGIDSYSKTLVTDLQKSDIVILQKYYTTFHKHAQQHFYIKGALRHEIGHLERHAALRRDIAASSIPFVAHFITTIVTAPFMSLTAKKTAASQLLCGLKYIPLAMIKFGLGAQLFFMHSRYEEAKADDVCIAHTHEPEILGALIKDFYSSRHLPSKTHPSSVSRSAKFLTAFRKLQERQHHNSIKYT